MSDATRIRAGELRQRIIVETETMATDASGGALPTYATLATVWAKIEPMDGAEKYNAQQTSASITHKISIRWRSGITAKHRVKYGTRIFRIVSVLDMEEFGKLLVLNCIEKAA